MNFRLHMVELQVNMSSLFGYLQAQELNLNRDEDLGYGMHAWLAGTFGDCAPKPFRLLHGNTRRPPRLLGYTSVEKAELLKRAQEFASPAALSVCNLEIDLHSKLMPQKWERGRRVGFRLLACPVSRKDGIEKDIFLRAADLAPNTKEQPLDRANIYCDWVVHNLQTCARTEYVKLEGFQMVQQFRRGESKRPGKLIRPKAEFSGVLQIEDGEKFAESLARGIGRHRAFGYGMLLLSPAP